MCPPVAIKQSSVQWLSQLHVALASTDVAFLRWDLKMAFSAFLWHHLHVTRWVTAWGDFTFSEPHHLSWKVHTALCQVRRSPANGGSSSKSTICACALFSFIANWPHLVAISANFKMLSIGVMNEEQVQPIWLFGIASPIEHCLHVCCICCLFIRWQAIIWAVTAPSIDGAIPRAPVPTGRTKNATGDGAACGSASSWLILTHLIQQPGQWLAHTRSLCLMCVYVLLLAV